MSVFQRTELRDIVRFSRLSYASTNIERDRQAGTYVVGADALAAVRCIAAGLNGFKRGMAVSVIGPYGSGKSTLGLFINRLVGPEVESRQAIEAVRTQSDSVARLLVDGRKKMDIDSSGMVRCRVMARREPIHITVLRAVQNGVAEYFGRYNSKSFDGASLLRRSAKAVERGEVPDSSDVASIIRGLCAKKPVILLIDEFGKNVEYFTGNDERAGDLFLLQELVESAGGRGARLGIVTFQHMAFDDYAAGASPQRRREWAKIQGRFEEVVFSNTLAQTQLIVSRMLSNNDSRITKWAENETTELRRLFGMDCDRNIAAKCYPLHPLTLAVLPELCSRYGQNERTLLSFMHGGGRHTVFRFIEEAGRVGDDLPTVGLDMLYDYFISGAGTVHGSSTSITRLREIETIIRDVRGLGVAETKALKTVGVLNLVGRTGILKASRKVVEHMVGAGAAGALRSLVDRTVLTYRDRTDEYRVWHGTDINVSARLGLCRKRYERTDPARLLPSIMDMEPVIASRHGARTGTVRIFQRLFSMDDFDASYDGAILYGANHADGYHGGRPVIVAKIDSAKLSARIIDMRAMKDLLKEPDILNDWVARNEIHERFVAAEAELRMEMSRSGDVRFSWKGGSLPGPPSHAASDVSDAVYDKTPHVPNEMINRNKLSGQAASARNILVEAMIKKPGAKTLGIEGWGAERSIYEAVLAEHGIHRDSKGFFAPKGNKSMAPAWKAVKEILQKASRRRGARGRVNLERVYDICRMPPYGMRDGVIPLMIIGMIMRHSDRIAVYEHGTFVNGMKVDVAERLVKNPAHFDLKYFAGGRKIRRALGAMAVELGEDADSGILDLAKAVVGRFSALNAYARNTKRMGTKEAAVRDTIVKAREPDVLLLESLPRALKAGPLREMGDGVAHAFARDLSEALDSMSGWFAAEMNAARKLILKQTGMKSVGEVAAIADALIQYAPDRELKKFMTSLATDLGDDEGWTGYVAMMLTGTPPASWKDGHRDIFQNRLHEMAGRFRRLASLRFNRVRDDVCLVTVTRPDGAESYDVVGKDAEDVAAHVGSLCKALGLGEEDVMAALGTKLNNRKTRDGQ